MASLSGTRSRVKILKATLAVSVENFQAAEGVETLPQRSGCP